MINRLLVSTLFSLCLLALLARTASGAAALTNPVEATDFVGNRYWEEGLLLWAGEQLYANVSPRWQGSPIHLLTSGAIAVRTELDGLLSSRINRYLDPGKMLLNDAGLMKTSGQRDLVCKLRFVPYFQELAASDTMPIHRLGLTGELWVAPTERLQVHLRTRLENHGDLYSQWNGRKWDEKITGWVDQAALYYALPRGVFASVGRSAMIWGPEQHDALLLSDNAPPLDRIWLGYEHPALRFDYFITRLDNVVHNDSTLVRYISAHRLSFRKQGIFELGLSELVLYGGHNRPIDWRYLNPFVPYYWEQWNRGSDDNLFFGLDFALYWPHQARIFGELMIDDFQIDFKSEPHQVGYKLGLDALEPLGLTRLFTKLSYTRVNTTVYGQNQPQNLYLYYGQPIGYFDGNDQDRILALCRYHVSRTFDTELEFRFTRKGEGRIVQHERSGVPYAEKFPTGVVETSPSVRFGLLLFDRRLIDGQLDLRYSHFRNYRNQDGRDEDRLEVNFFLAWFLQGLSN